MFFKNFIMEEDVENFFNYFTTYGLVFTQTSNFKRKLAEIISSKFTDQFNI